MSNAPEFDLAEYCQSVSRAAKQASRILARCRATQKRDWLLDSAQALKEKEGAILAANAEDLGQAGTYGLDSAQCDRLKLDPKRIDAMARALEEIAAIPDPIGQEIESSVRPSGLSVKKIRVPLGVIFFIYESRPNVTADAAALCIKSGNAVILRGGKEAARSNETILNILSTTAVAHGIPANAMQRVATTDREAVGHFLTHVNEIDLAIPRGGEGLIRRVVAEARMPVIKHYSGNCHVYVDASADLATAVALTVNAKTQRMGVCNAAESLLVHSAVADSFLPRVAAELESRGVEIRGDEAVCAMLPKTRRATKVDFETEYLGPILAVAIVADVDAAIAHIHQFGSGHTEAIVSSDAQTIQQFVDAVDSSAVMVNASTRFNDGGELGLGAEIGISTDKIHARGPCGVKELTSYKYVVRGQGHIR